MPQTNPKKYRFVLPTNLRPDFCPLNEELHPAFSWLTKNRTRARPRDVFESIDTVVVHATAGFATQHAVDAWRQNKASAHWIVPDEDEPQHGEFVWATAAEAKAAYHVRDGIKPEQFLSPGLNVNNRSLGIEIVNTQDVQSFSDPYSDWQIDSVARIVLYAWAKYPNLKYVISHAMLDPTRRSDPGKNFPWDDFKERVLSHSAIEFERNPLVFAAHTPPDPIDHPGNCCLP